MGREGTQQTAPDLFAVSEVRDASAASIKSCSDRVTTVPSASQRHILPENLDLAIKQLNDDDLMQLLEVALREAKQRGKSPLRTDGDMRSSRQTDAATQKIPKGETRAAVADVTLSPGKLNAVRAAFKAGITPSRIARQFGISQSNVRKALAEK